MSDPEHRRALRARLAAEAPRFDLGPLLRQLERAGVAREDIIFESNPEPTAHGALIEGLEISEAPGLRAVIRLNMGLSGPGGLVPSYFHELAAEHREQDLLELLLHFFDHPLLDTFVDAVYPETPTGAMHALPQLRKASFSMLGVGSIATLEWFFCLLFPELRVAVSRVNVPMPTDAYALHAGSALLDGAGVLGVIDEPRSAGFGVELFAEEEENEAGKPWIDLVEDRVEQVALPTLRPYALTLRVALNVADHGSWAHLETLGPERSDEQPGYLGYDRIHGGRAAHRVVVFEGPTHGGPQP
jgi:hypothetical protein